MKIAVCIEKIFAIAQNGGASYRKSEVREFMLFRTQSAAVYGIDANLVDIEVNLQPIKGEADSNPIVTIVGLPDAAVRESRRR